MLLAGTRLQLPPLSPFERGSGNAAIGSYRYLTLAQGIIEEIYSPASKIPIDKPLFALSGL
jgi:hypothetical protein